MNIHINKPTIEKCKESEIGSHDCNVLTPYGFCCDVCLYDEIVLLNELGITTRGSCCGHNRLEPFIQVADDDVQKMKDLRYTLLEVDEYGNGINAFKPHSFLIYERSNMNG